MIRERQYLLALAAGLMAQLGGCADPGPPAADAGPDTGPPRCVSSGIVVTPTNAEGWTPNLPDSRPHMVSDHHGGVIVRWSTREHDPTDWFHPWGRT
jgi:hypothetical protein